MQACFWDGALAKEKEPSFRFLQTPAACAEADLIAVVPWCLGNVISGRPRVFTPYLECARYAAEYRNYHWRFLRDAQSDATILSPAHPAPYPKKSESTNDQAHADKGGNFGRFARSGLMDAYLERMKAQPLCGINACYWLDFFKIFQEHSSEDKIQKALARLRAVAAKETALSGGNNTHQEALLRILDEIERLVAAC